MERPPDRMAERKVKGGKLVRVKAAVEGRTLTEVRIEGDFFVHPEEGLAKMEVALIGLNTSGILRSAETALTETMTKEGLTVIGFAPGDVAELLEEICSATDGA
jgi:lipoate-protein ligase A